MRAAAGKRVAVVVDSGVPLRGYRLTTLAVNVPGPAAAARLAELGAEVVKIEPPGGDPLEAACPDWYREMASGQRVERLDLKREEDARKLEEILADSDLLLTSSRPSALARLCLSPEKAQARHPRLAYVEIVGYPPPREEEPGHDLTYLAELGLLASADMPRSLLADLSGAQEAANAALALLLERERYGERGGEARHIRVSLSEAARRLAAPLRHGITAPGGILGGGDPMYGVYETQAGRIALAALEPHFRKRLLEELGLEKESSETLRSAFAERSAAEWEDWAAERDLPIAEVREDPWEHRKDYKEPG